MEFYALRLHLSQVVNAAARARPQMARLVLRAGIFMVVPKYNQKVEDKLIWLMSPESFYLGFRYEIWDIITRKAQTALEEYAHEQTAKNTN